MCGALVARFSQREDTFSHGTTSSALTQHNEIRFQVYVRGHVNVSCENLSEYRFATVLT